MNQADVLIVAENVEKDGKAVGLQLVTDWVSGMGRIWALYDLKNVPISDDGDKASGGMQHFGEEGYSSDQLEYYVFCSPVLEEIVSFIKGINHGARKTQDRMSPRAKK